MMKQSNGNNFRIGVTEHKTREGRKLYLKSFCFEIIRSIGSCKKTSNKKARVPFTHIYTHTHTTGTAGGTLPNQAVGTGTRLSQVHTPPPLGVRTHTGPGS